jgi:long-chain fatty acid transport protein
MLSCVGRLAPEGEDPPNHKAGWRAIASLLIVVWAVFLSPSPSTATGFRLFPQSASGAGQANAVIAQSDDPSAVFYNPAGITQLEGVQVMGGVLLAGGSTHFTQSATGAQSTGDLGGPISTPPPAHFYLTANLKALAEKWNLAPLERITVGVGVFSSFGLQYRWPEDGPLNTSITRASLPLINIRPVAAYQVSKELSVAIGADVYTFSGLVGEGQFEEHFNSSGAPGLPPPGTPIEINGKGTSAGVNVSFRYTPCMSDNGPRCSIGFLYRSQSTLHLDGQFMVAGAQVANTRATLVLPQSFTFGFAAWPVRDAKHQWKVEVDFDKTDWGSFQNTDLHLSTGAVIPNPRNWTNTWSIMTGTEYKRVGPDALPNWDATVRAGYMYSPTPIPSQTFDPALPDANSHTLALGAGLLCKPGGKFVGLIGCGDEGQWYRPSSIGLDLAFQAALYETRHISGNIPPLTAPAVVNGTYSTTQYVGLISIRLNF